MPRLRQSTGARRVFSPKSSGGRAGPSRCKRLATAADAVLYNHAIGTSLVTGVSCSASPSNRRLRAAGPDESDTGSPTRALPLLTDRAVSRRPVYPSPPRCRGSISMSWPFLPHSTMLSSLGLEIISSSTLGRGCCDSKEVRGSELTGGCGRLGMRWGT